MPKAQASGGSARDAHHESAMRQRPNILVTGTPGTGKTTMSARLAEETGFEHICVGELVKEKELHEGWDEEFQTYLLDEDKLCDELEDRMQEGGKIVDFHTCDVFPERWFDLVLVLRTNTETLWDRLQQRGYNEAKVNENMESEIMQVCLDEARESYAPEIVIELPSNSLADHHENQSRTLAWIAQWTRDQQKRR